MTDEVSAIALVKAPLTHSDIVNGLRQMGLAAGDLVLLHVSLSRLGWTPGGAQTLLAAVLEVLGPDGTMVMPGFSGQLTDPACWTAPPVPVDWVDPIRDAMPLFDPDATPTRGIGRVAEALRALPETQRSLHPVVSFLAHGPLARPLLADHALDHGFGATSPLGKLRDHGARVLLLGAGFDTCTAFHLAEENLPGIANEPERIPVRRENSVTIWQDTTQAPTFEEHFAQIGAAFEQDTTAVTRGFADRACLFDMATGVRFARNWLETAALHDRLS